MTKEQSMIYVGIDVSKDKLAVAIAGGGVRDELLSLGSFENAPASVDLYGTGKTGPILVEEPRVDKRGQRHQLVPHVGRKRPVREREFCKRRLGVTFC